jgi:broad specificity phosphatase PhoE
VGAIRAGHVRSFLDDALAEGVDTAAYTHDGWSRIAACVVLGLPVWRRRALRADTCGITELEWDGERGGWDPVRLNAK